MHITCKTMALLTDFPVVHQSSEECLLRQLWLRLSKYRQQKN
jgi:hypothetical protein